LFLFLDYSNNNKKKVVGVGCMTTPIFKIVSLLSLLEYAAAVFRQQFLGKAKKRKKKRKEASLVVEES
jgi:hypothetical protein